MGLPLRMENLHAPTVPSGPVSTRPEVNKQRKGSSFAELQAKKDDIEAEIKALSSVLDSHGVNMNTPLVTPDGFPRSDLDVAQIRTTRSRIIYLKNDYKSLMDVIEKHIHEHFATLAETSAAESTTNSIISSNTRNELPLRDAVTPDHSFAKVNSVVSGSPAESAGLKVGDEIRRFGYVNHTNHDGLKRVGECVQGNENLNILVKVSRSVADSQRRQELDLTLTPRRDWGGRGLLGCHILPL